MWPLIACFIFSSLIQVQAAPASGVVSHEDIRDAILSLVTIFRDNSDKLERHEYRERQLGEQLKKALSGLDKRYRAQDVLISQMADQIKNIETKITQKQDRDHQQLTTISNTVGEIRNTLSNVMKDIEAGSKGNQAAYSIQGSTDSEISAKLDEITATLKSDEPTRKAMKETENIIRKLEKKWESGASTSDPNFAKQLNLQSELLGNILDVAKETSSQVRELPKKGEVKEIFTSTTDMLKDIRGEMMEIGERGTALIASRLDENLSRLSLNQEDLMKTASEIQSMVEGFNSGVSQSYEQLLSEVRGLSKVEQVMIQTADNVMDTKRRVEYGVHQILLEVGELVKQQGKTFNGTVNKRFDDIALTILDNQSGSLSNLTTKIETEISQVWRQIGIMYEQLTASATALDRLQQQTDAYVNGSIKTMDSMENKVVLITSRMTEVDDNLNFLLGRLSLVTSEYNQIKSGLAKALDDIRDSFVDVETKLKDVGPGPRPINPNLQSHKTGE